MNVSLIKLSSKFTFFLVCYLSCTSFLAGQSYLKMIDSGTFPVQEVIDSANVYFEGKDLGRGSGYKQFKRWEYNALRMADESGYLKSQDEYLKELERFLASYYSDSRTREINLGDYWEDLGPDYWNATSGWNPGVGRLTGFTVDPNDHEHIIVGAETGGVWKTYNAGQQWIPLNDFFSNMAVYATAMHPKERNTYYFGSSGGRIYKSSDGGEVWNQIGSAGSSLINKILIHPENPELMFASSQWSGLFRSTNGGASWQRVTDDQNGFDFQFAPDDLNTVYASGAGFHISTDGGETFQSANVPLPLRIYRSNGSIHEYQVVSNSFNPGRVPLPIFPDSIYGRIVIYRDADGGNLGCEEPENGDEFDGNIVMITRGTCAFVQKVLNAQAFGAAAVIVVNNEEGAIAMGGGDASIAIPAVMVTSQVGDFLRLWSNNNVLFARLSDPGSVAFANGAKMIGTSKDEPDWVYVLEASNNIFGGIYRSTNRGASFTKLDQGGRNYFGYSTQGADDRGQAPRDMAIAVNPYDAREVHIAGINTWVSFDAGETFLPTSDWTPSSAASQGIGYCHADVDIMEFVDSTLYLGTDGGIFKATQTKQISRDYYIDMTEGLGIRQFYKIGISQSNPVIVSGGSQDNGTSALIPNEGWIDWLGADGMETFIDINNNQVMYGTSQFGRMYRSSNSGRSYNSLSRPGSGDGRWVTPFEQDPIFPNTIYVGYEQVFKSTNNGASWEDISQEFSAKLEHLKIAESDNRVMYASFGSNLFKTISGGGQWERLTGFQGDITSIAIHPSDSELIAISTRSNQKVFISRDGGRSWEGFRRNLPDFNALALVWQENLYDDFLDGLYLGMNYGVYYIDNTLDQWVLFNNLLPNVIINELEINYADGHIYAATYGRGLWRSPLADFFSNTKVKQPRLNVNVFPNPAADYIKLSVGEEDLEHWASEVSIFDVQGRLLYKQRLVEINAHSIPLHTFSNGHYYLRLSTGKGSIVKPFVIAR